MKSSSSKSPLAHVLIVDDNKLGLAARTAVLEELGYKVTTVAAPPDALQRLSSERYDLIITDYKMPGMNGVELIARLRKMECAATPVILISGFTDVMGLSTKTTGADIVLQKSSNEVAHMMRAVKVLLKDKSKPGRKPAGRQAAAAKAGRKQA